MTHDYAHCLDYTEDCPPDCFRAQLVKDLRNREDMIGIPVSWIHFRHLPECAMYAPKPTNGDRIRAMTDEELADFIGGIFTIERDPWGDYDPRTVVTQEPRVELRSRDDALNWLLQEAVE